VLAVRSYRNLGEDQAIPNGHNWTCEDAALATTAAPGFFKRHRIDRGIHGYFFEDAGANRMNNPTKFMLDECQMLDQADQQLNATDNALFVSVGTGNWKPDIRTTCGFLGLLKNKKATLKATLRHATDVDEVHNYMKKQARGSKMYVAVVAEERFHGAGI
jgi:patatin-like phospholipase/acyl hydrolase